MLHGKHLAEALLDFYKKILKPDFDAIKGKLTEHDERFSEVFGHFDATYHRLGRIEDEQLMMNNRLDRIDEAIKQGNQTRQQLEKRVMEMKEQLANLQGRLETLERQLDL